MNIQTFKGLTFQLLQLLKEHEAGMLIFAHYANKNNPNRISCERKIQELRMRIEIVLVDEGVNGDTIIKAIIAEKELKYVERIDSLGI